MFTFQLSLTVILAILALLALLAASLAFGVWWLLRALRLGQFKDAVECGSRALKEATAGAAKSVVMATNSNSENVLELVRQLRTVQDGIRELAPTDIREALTRVAKLHAKDLTEKYRDQLKEQAEKIELYEVWLRALTGGQGELGRAAMRGLPKGLPEDLAGRLDAVVSQRRGHNVNGRQQPSMFR